MKTLMTCTIIMIVSATLSGCTSKTSSTTSNGPLEKADADFVDSSAYLLSAEPKDATSVIRVREEAASDDEVLIVGCIGGSSNP